jgi:type IV pilus assembly protein PilM
MSRTVWGLDISASAIKGVRMRLEGERIQILEADIVPFEGEAPAAETPGRDRRIWQALHRFVTSHALRREKVIVGLPGSIFLVRPVNVIQVGERSEAELVRFELEQHIPFGLDAVLWDYELFENPDPASREREGLVFAMKKDVLNNYFLSLSTVQVDPAMVQAAPLALYNFIRYEIDLAQPTLVADIGAGNTNLLAIHGPRYWMRTLNVGADTMTAALRGAFRPRELTYEEAESIKVHLGRLSARGEVIERINPALRSFVGEIRNGCRHMAQEHKQSFDRMYLLGGGAGMYGIARLLGDELKMRVITPAGLGRIEPAGSVAPEYISANLPLLATAIGLGLQGLGRSATRVNMVGSALVERRSQTIARRSIAAGLVTALAVTAATGVYASWRNGAYTAATDKITGLVGPIQLRESAYRRLKMPGNAEAVMAKYEDLTADRAVWLTVLDKVAGLMPPENKQPAASANRKLWLLRLSLKRKPNVPGAFEGEIEAGVNQHAGAWKYANETIKVALEGDERKIFKNVTEGGSLRTASLVWPAGDKVGVGVQERYYLVRYRFDVVPPEKEAAP